jgi:hypothetical protein
MPATSQSRASYRPAPQQHAHDIERQTGTRKAVQRGSLLRGSFAFAGCGAGGFDVPFLAERRQLQRLRDLLLRQGLGHVCACPPQSARHDTRHTTHDTHAHTLFVGEDEHEGVFEGVLLHYSVELVPRLRQSIVVRAVDHEYHALSRPHRTQHAPHTRKRVSVMRVVWRVRLVCVCVWLPASSGSSGATIVGTWPDRQRPNNQIADSCT